MKDIFWKLMLLVSAPLVAKQLPKFRRGPSRFRRLLWWYQLLRDNQRDPDIVDERWGKGAAELAAKLLIAFQTSDMNYVCSVLKNSFIMPESVAKNEAHKWGYIPDQEIHGG